MYTDKQNIIFNKFSVLSFGLKLFQSQFAVNRIVYYNACNLVYDLKNKPNRNYILSFLIYFISFTLRT